MRHRHIPRGVRRSVYVIAIVLFATVGLVSWIAGFAHAGIWTIVIIGIALAAAGLTHEIVTQRAVRWLTEIAVCLELLLFLIVAILALIALF